ncbi:MAG TPA: SURF1 family cytochrome oxidase biogenesis protein [Allosphingosinicella sp.]|jgi:hypothetical protein
MRIPFLPTVIVGAAVAVMIGLGLWQLQRAEWKERLIAEAAAPGPRSATLTCTVDARPAARAGRSRGGEIGYRFLVPCRGAEGTLTLDLGWSKRPNALPHLRATRTFTGTFAGGQAAANRLLVLATPVPPLEPSAVPSAADLPNNHLLYALQWFFFAAAAAVIYALALRRRRAGG